MYHGCDLILTFAKMDKRVERVLDNELKRINNEIQFIHRGGCGVFAILLWDMLTFTGYITEPIELYDGYPDWNFSSNGINSVYWDVHNGGANFVWVDGHVSWHKRGDWQDAWYYYDQ